MYFKLLINKHYLKKQVLFWGTIYTSNRIKKDVLIEFEVEVSSSVILMNNHKVMRSVCWFQKQGGQDVTSKYI